MYSGGVEFTPSPPGGVYGIGGGGCEPPSPPLFQSQAGAAATKATRDAKVTTDAERMAEDSEGDGDSTSSHGRLKYHARRFQRLR